MQQNDVTRSIGARVRAMRAHAGLSRRRLAAIADVSERYLNQLETGEANVSVGILSRVAEALGVDLAHLLPSAQPPAAPGRTTNTMHAPLAVELRMEAVVDEGVLMKSGDEVD